MKKILVAVDESPFSFQVAEYVYKLAKPFNSEVALLHIVDKAVLPSFNETGPLHEEVLLKMKEQSTDFLAKLTLEFKELKTLSFSLIGIPAEEIIKTSLEWQADLIVTGTHGRTGLKRLFMGSVAEEILRHSTCPVLVLPSGTH